MLFDADEKLTFFYHGKKQVQIIDVVSDCLLEKRSHGLEYYCGVIREKT